MPLNKIILNEVDTYSNLVIDTNGRTFDMDGALQFSLQEVITDTTPASRSFYSGQYASVDLGDFSLTAVTLGAAGNGISIAATNPAYEDAPFEISVDGLAISIQLATDSGGSITTTANDMVSGINGYGPAAALVTASGGNTNIVGPGSTNLSGGVDSDVTLDPLRIYIPNHGFVTGLKVDTGGGGPLWVIKIDDNYISAASSKQNAFDGIPVDPGPLVPNQTTTITPVALVGQVGVQKSNDGETWFDCCGIHDVTESGEIFFERTPTNCIYIRPYFKVTTGMCTIITNVLVKGFN